MLKIVEKIARDIYTQARGLRHEYVCLVGIKPDLAYTVMPLKDGRLWRNGFEINGREHDEAIHRLGATGHRWIIRAHSGPRHKSPSSPDVRGLGDPVNQDDIHGLMRAHSLQPPMIDMVVSQTTGSFGTYIIRQPRRWSGRAREGYWAVDPAKVWSWEDEGQLVLALAND